jgi:hypothetical protein
MFLMLCLLAGMGASTAWAQIDTDTTVEANIPYTFVVGSTTLPAGKYIVRMPDSSEPNVLEIRAANGHTAVAFETSDANQTPNKDGLVFNKIGDTYFLSQVWITGSASGNQLAKSKMEKRLEANGTQSQQTVVATIMRHLKRIKKAV